MDASDTPNTGFSGTASEAQSSEHHKNSGDAQPSKSRRTCRVRLKAMLGFFVLLNFIVHSIDGKTASASVIGETEFRFAIVTEYIFIGNYTEHGYNLFSRFNFFKSSFWNKFVVNGIKNRIRRYDGFAIYACNFSEYKFLWYAILKYFHLHQDFCFQRRFAAKIFKRNNNLSVHGVGNGLLFTSFTLSTST